MDIFDYDNILLLPRKCRVASRSECDASVQFGPRRRAGVGRGGGGLAVAGAGAMLPGMGLGHGCGWIGWRARQGKRPHRGLPSRSARWPAVTSPGSVIPLPRSGEAALGPLGFALAWSRDLRWEPLRLARVPVHRPRLP